MTTVRMTLSAMLVMPMAVAAACSDAPTETPEQNATGGSGGASGHVSSSTTSHAEPPHGRPPRQPREDCYDNGTALGAPGTMPEVAKMDCTATQLDDLSAACFSGGDEGVCQAFLDDASNDACLGCVFGEEGDHHPPLLLGHDVHAGQSIYVNIPACESLAQGQAQCAAPTSNFTFCVYTKCETCISAPEEDACTARALAPDGVCSATVDVPAECQPVLEMVLDLNLTDLSAECAGTDFTSLYLSAANYICGAGAN